MKNFFAEHKTLSIIIAAVVSVAAAAIIVTVVVLNVKHNTDNGDVNSTNSSSVTSSAVNIPDIVSEPTSSETLSDDGNFISPDENAASSSSSSTSTAPSSSSAPKKAEARPTAPKDKNGTTASQAPAAPATSAPTQPTTPTQPSNPGLSESTNKPLDNWTGFEFDEEALKNAKCDCCGLPLGDGTNGTCEGSSRTIFVEDGKAKERLVCKNGEKVVTY